MILATYETDGAADAIGVVDGQTIFDVRAGAASTPGGLVKKAAPGTPNIIRVKAYW